MSIVKLPSGYRQLEYIQSSGTQYVDTGFKPNNNTRVVCDIQLHSNSEGQTLFGARTSATSKNYAIMVTNGALRSDYNGTYEQSWAVTIAERRTIDKNKETTIIDGITQIYTNSVFQCDYSLYLLALNNAGAVRWFTTAKLFSCQIYDNGSLVRDFIPCINDSGVVGLYDLIGGAFYSNAGTGAFTAGRYVYSEDEIKKLEYIESSGTQYVDSGFAPNQDTRVVMDCDLLSSREVAGFFGARNGWASAAFYLLSQADASNYQSCYGTDAGNYTSIDSTIGRHVIDKNKNQFLVDKTIMKTEATMSFVASYPMYLFAVNFAGAVSFKSYMKLYSCQIYDDGTIVRDYYPASVEGEVGLWDALSGVFYGNDGTGDFLAGPLLAVDTPTAFEQIMAVYLKWAAVDCEGYKIYRNGVFLDSTTNTFYADLSAEENENYVYTLLAYRGSTESEPVDLEVYTRSGYFTIKPLIQSAFFQ